MQSREIVGRFVLLDPIGSGATGRVWRAWDRRREAFVAVKVLTRVTDDLLVRFVREQSMRIAHPHIASPTGWAAEDDEVVLVMDLVRGGCVADLLSAHGGLPVGYVAVLLDQVLDALGAAHTLGIVHRDLKPTNLLLEPTGTGPPHLRVADFGVAARAGIGTAVDEVVGTDDYMAPEQADGAPPDPAQDLYAVGRVGVELLTGRRPAHGTPAPAGPLRDLLRGLLEPDPGRRTDSAAVARARLHELRIGFRDQTDRPPDVPDRLGCRDAPRAPRGEGVRPARRRRVPWWVGS